MRAQEIGLGARIANATGVVYIDLPQTPRPSQNGRVAVQIDGENTPRTFEIIHVVDRVHGHQSHYETFVRAV